jgi:site-specific DNA recombinase
MDGARAANLLRRIPECLRNDPQLLKMVWRSSRFSYAIANSRRKPDELLRRIDECDVERETVEERLRLLASGSENVIPFDPPSFGELYRLEVKRLTTALKINPKAIEPGIAFRNLIDCIGVHPVR